MELPSTPAMAFLTVWSRPGLPLRLSRLARGGLLSGQPPHRLGPRSRARCLMTSGPATVEASGVEPKPSAQAESGMFSHGTSFADLGASPDFADALARRGIVTPTNVQAAVIPLLMRGLDIQVDYATQVRAADEATAALSGIAEEAEDDGDRQLDLGSEEHAQVEEETADKAAAKRPVPPEEDADDVLMIGAETGSGKTLAYLLPYVEAARKTSDVDLKAVILVPSRELCWQVADLLTAYFPKAPRHLVLAGGQPPDVADVKAVRAVIATPAALLNYFRFSSKSDASDKVIVVDEADMLLSGSFLRDVEKILDQPGMKPFATRRNGDIRKANRNRLLFVGATYPHWTGEKVRSIVTWMRRRYPGVKAVQTEDIHKRSAQLRSRWRLLKTELERVDALVELLQEETGEKDKVMVFASKAETSQRAYETVLARVGVQQVADKFGGAVQLHKNVSGDKRRENLVRFRRGETRLLFCTDLGARGLDLGDVTWVVEFDFSTNVVGYLHRIGRTARAGASGRTDHFYDEVSRPLAEAIRERAERETTVVDGVFSRKRSFRRKLKKRQGEAAGLEDVVIDEIDAEEEKRLRG